MSNPTPHQIPQPSQRLHLDYITSLDEDARMETDPVCGRLVEASQSQFTFTLGAETFHFCSAACKFVFLSWAARNPGKQVDAGDFPATRR